MLRLLALSTVVQNFEFVVWRRLAKKDTKERLAGLLVLIEPIELLIYGVFVALLAVVQKGVVDVTS